MTELSALAGSEGYAACDDDGVRYCSSVFSWSALLVSVLRAK